MYIKLIFKRQEWNVPNANNGYIDGLYVAPAIVKELPHGVQANCFSPARSQFLAMTPEIISYYLDCGDATKSDIQNALKLFNGLYDVEAKGLPAALASSDPDGNEIIANSKIALFNATHSYTEWKQFQLVNSMSTAEDFINSLTC